MRNSPMGALNFTKIAPLLNVSHVKKPTAAGTFDLKLHPNYSLRRSKDNLNLVDAAISCVLLKTPSFAIFSS